eukprot:275243-Prorocentrum_lima.AAC.1
MSITIGDREDQEEGTGSAGASTDPPDDVPEPVTGASSAKPEYQGRVVAGEQGWATSLIK